jgi:56kDa selenium binding protein (SBP56)
LGVVIDSTNLEGSIWTWWLRGRQVLRREDSDHPAEPATKQQLRPLLQGFGAAPPLISDIDLSLADKSLYVACWGTGEMRQYGNWSRAASWHHSTMSGVARLRRSQTGETACCRLIEGTGLMGRKLPGAEWATARHWF